MTHDASLPADLRTWVTEHLPGVASAVDVSWPRGDSRVWRVTAATDGGTAAGTVEAFVKLSPSTQDYAREVRGYEYAARWLAAHEAPRLLAADPGLHAIMTSPLPGRVVRGLPLEAEEERRIHQLAGRLLRRWHDNSGQVADQEREAILESVAEQADEAAACLETTAEHLNCDQRALVQSVHDELPQLAEELPIVYRHGDYSTRNWLWAPEHGEHGEHGHGVIDFAGSAHGVAVEEFVWLCGAVWAPRPDLQAAYFTGYGRPLSVPEQRALPLFTARLGVSYLAAGLTKRDPVLVERGQLVLTRMTRDHR